MSQKHCRLREAILYITGYTIMKPAQVLYVNREPKLPVDTRLSVTMFEESMRDTDTNCIATQGWCGCVFNLYVCIFFSALKMILIIRIDMLC